MTTYVDTSVLVAALTNEAATQSAQAWLSRQTPGDLAMSPWVGTEFSAALSVKVRIGAITSDQRALVLATFRRLATASFRMLAVEFDDFERAASLADQFALGLRAGDALHLAIALTRDVTLCTLDRRLAEAAGALGIRTVAVGAG